MIKLLVSLFTETFGAPPREAIRLTPDGSQRAYVRLTGGPHESVIGAYGPDPDENRAFLSFSRTFRGLGLPVPEIYAAAEGQGLWIEEDLGDTTLFEALTEARGREPDRFPDAMLAFYQRVIEFLPRFQVEGGRAIDFSVAYPRAAFDRQSMMWDLNYFKYHFLKLAHVPFNEQRLENDFQRLTDHLLTADASYFLYRDYQSRNIMLRGSAPWFLDYQGGRRGALPYDIASLLYDAKANIPDAVRERLLEHYLESLAGWIDLDRAEFLDLYRGFALIRILQSMGAYGYRGFFERKPRFLESVPYAARNLRSLLAAGLPVDLPEVERVLEHIAESWAERGAPAPPPNLTVRIASFSFKSGPPADESGHGGGYVFDCRALPNPGRHPDFAKITGRDPSVIRFLEATREVETFWSHVAAIVDAHVENFRERRFAELSVAFGCTGGQHRSVYFAERLARHLTERHPDVVVRLRHGESGRWPELEPGSPDETSAGVAAGAPPMPPRAGGPAWTR